MPTTTQTCHARKAGQIEREREHGVSYFFSFGKGAVDSAHTGVSEQERAAIIIVWEICSLFVRAPLHAADTKISHVIGFARRGGKECSSLCI